MRVVIRCGLPGCAAALLVPQDSPTDAILAILRLHGWVTREEGRAAPVCYCPLHGSNEPVLEEANGV